MGSKRKASSTSLRSSSSASPHNFSSINSKPSELPWQAWTLDQDFLRRIYDWNRVHPQNTLDRIIQDTLIGEHELVEIIPDGLREFAKALAHLVKLGETIIEAKAAAFSFVRDILRRVEKLVSAYGGSEKGRLISETWDDLTETGKVIDDTCGWAHRMLNSSLTTRTYRNEEISCFQKQLTKARERLAVLSNTNPAKFITPDLPVGATGYGVAPTDIHIGALNNVGGSQYNNHYVTYSQDLDTRGQNNSGEMVQMFQSPDATYNTQKKHPCDRETRVETLGLIIAWIDDISDSSPYFFWLAGDPGVGKSAIAASITRECERRRILSAQLFINRNDARTIDPKSFFPSIAKQMSESSPAVANAIKKVLKEQPHLMDGDISAEQAKTLFLDTIRVASESSPTEPVVIIIDALDETDLERLERTVEIFSEVLVDLPHNTKVFITSRAEDVIQYGFADRLKDPRVKHMHISAKDSVPEVSKFLERKIAKILERYRLDQLQWGEERMLDQWDWSRSGLGSGLGHCM